MKITAILIFVLLIFNNAFSQEFSNVVFYKKDNKIIVTYDLLNAPLNQAYDIRLRFISNAGKSYFARTINGDTKKVQRGKNKIINWDFSKDENNLPDSIKPNLEVSKTHYNFEPEKKKKKYDPAEKKAKTAEEKSRELKGLYFGINVGVHFANKLTANYYNGSAGNNLQNIFLQDLSNPQSINTRYNEIKNVLHYDFRFDSTSTPKDMKYDLAYMLGFVMKYHFNNLTALCFELNNVRLTTTDIFTLQIDSTTSFQSPNYVQCNIYGTETRFDLNLSLYRVFGERKILNPYAEFGVNLNNTAAKKNEIQIKTLTYSIMNPNTNYYNQVQGGIGYGIIVGAGCLMNVSSKFAFDIGFNVGIKKINLGENQAFKPNTSIYIRMLLKTFNMGFSKGSSTENTDPAKY